jgi:uncharacterized repeat protein (TIGR03943 family)
MNARLDNFLKAIIFAASGLMLYAKISDGTLAFYINQRFAWLTMLGVVLFFALALTMVYRALVTQDRSLVPSAIEEGTELQLVRANVHQQQGASHRASWVAVALLTLPVVSGFFTPARPLGAGAIESRGIGLIAPDRPGTATQAERVTTGPKNILDWLRDFSRNADPAAFNGKEADVVGFVYRDPRSGENEFWVSRFTVSCCVADASAIGLLVQTDEASALTADSWVRVTGKFTVGEFAGEKLPVITAEKIEPTEQPSQPYLYP